MSNDVVNIAGVKLDPGRNLYQNLVKLIKEDQVNIDFPSAVDIEKQFWRFEDRHHFFGTIVGERYFAEKDKTLSEVSKAKEIRHLATKIKKVAADKNKLEIKRRELAKLSNDSDKKTIKENEIIRLQRAIEETEDQYSKLSGWDKVNIDNYLSVQSYKQKISLYQQLFKFCKTVTDEVEHNSTSGDILAYEQAYKMIVLFEDKDFVQTVRGFEKYLKSHFQKYSPNKLYNFFVTVGLPNNGQSVSLDKWREQIAKHGAQVVEYFKIADQIEEAKNAGNNLNADSERNDLDEMRATKISLSYKREVEDKVLARLCLTYGISEEIFDRCLDINKDRKERDNLPEIKVNENDFWLVKLPIDDPRVYLLGHITNCCQSIGGTSEQCVIDGVTRENNGFYVLLKERKHKQLKGRDPIDDDGAIDYSRYDIVGQGYAWLSQADNLVFDSWENLRPAHDNPIVAEMLKEFGKSAAENESSNISRVVVGLGGATPVDFINPNKYSEEMKEGFRYADSVIQGTIYESTRLKDISEKIAELLYEHEFNPEVIASYKPARKFLQFIQNSDHCRLVEEMAQRIGSMEVVVQNLCLYGYDLEELFEYRDLGEIKVAALTSYGAWRVCGDEFCTLADLSQLPAAKIYALTATDARLMYENGYCDFKELKDYSVDKIEVLTSSRALNFYKNGFCSVTSLKDFDTEKIEALVSSEAIAAYINNFCTFDDLKHFDAKKIKALVSGDARRVCSSEICGLKDLEDLSSDKIDALVSSEAQISYTQKFYSFAELQSFDVNKIRALTAPSTINACVDGICEFDDLRVLDADTIYALTYRVTQQACKNKICSFKDLKEYSARKIRALTSESAQQLYESKRCQFLDLKDFSVEKIEALISPEAQRVYALGISFVDLKGYSVDRIRDLISVPAYQAYELNITPDDINELFDLDMPTEMAQEYLAKLTDNIFYGISEVYAAGATFKELLDIVITDPKRFNLLAAPNARALYAKGVKFAELKNLKLNQLVILTSVHALGAYNQGLKLEYLDGLSAKEIQAFFYCRNSESRGEQINSKRLQHLLMGHGIHGRLIGKLSSPNVSKYQALISDKALAAYAVGGFGIKDLKSFDIKKINVLISKEAQELYQSGIKF